MRDLGTQTTRDDRNERRPSPFQFRPTVELREIVRSGIWCPTMGADAVYAAEKALDELVSRLDGNGDTPFSCPEVEDVGKGLY